ncbi:MAG: exosortase-associated EpsI family protein [Waddliaceae bacterium]
MNGFSQPLLWICLTAASALAFLWQFTSLPDAQERMETLPLSGLEYQGRDLLLEPSEKEFLNGVHVLKRAYVIGDQEFFITVLDGSRHRHVVHNPYCCFQGSGWSIVEEKPLPLNKGDANLLLIKKRGQEREVVFWFSDGKQQYASPLRYWTQTTLRRLSLGMIGNEPLLIVIQPIQKEKIDWKQFMLQFSSLFEL